MPTSTSPLITPTSGLAIPCSAVNAGGATTTVTSSYIWKAWNQTYMQVTTTSSGGTAILLGTNTTLTTGQLWQVWNQAYTVQVLSSNAGTACRPAGWVVGNHPQLSPEEELQAQTRVQQEWQLRAQAEEAERQRARERAAIILREHLTDAQKAELADKRYFTIRTLRPQGEERIYRIHRGRSRNVEQVDQNGKRLKTLCIHPDISCPDEDTMLAQKLLLESEEDQFLRIANHS